jgi:hypothetical protein
LRLVRNGKRKLPPGVVCRRVGRRSTRSYKLIKVLSKHGRVT